MSLGHNALPAYDDPARSIVMPWCCSMHDRWTEAVARRRWPEYFEDE